MQPRTLLARIFWYAGALLMLAMAGVMLYVVTARYFFNKPPLWSEDVPRTIFVWMVFVNGTGCMVDVALHSINWYCPRRPASVG